MIVVMTRLQEDATELAVLLQSLEPGAMLRSPDGRNVPLPPAAGEALADVIRVLQQGRRAIVVGADELMSTQQVADVLQVSRPTVVRLLEQGAIPYQKAGSHRRVRVEDLEAFQIRRASERRKHLHAMAEETSLAEFPPDVFTATR